MDSLNHRVLAISSWSFQADSRNQFEAADLDSTAQIRTRRDLPNRPPSSETLTSRPNCREDGERGGGMEAKWGFRQRRLGTYKHNGTGDGARGQHRPARPPRCGERGRPRRALEAGGSRRMLGAEGGGGR